MFFVSNVTTGFTVFTIIIYRYFHKVAKTICLFTRGIVLFNYVQTHKI